MQKKNYVLMAVVTMVALVLAGCNLPASSAPATTATSAVPFPVATNNALVQEILRQTLTAAAANTTPMPTEALATQALPTAVATLSQFTPTVGSTSAALTATAVPTSALLLTTPTPGQPTQFPSCSGVPGYGQGVPIVSIVDVAQNAQVTIDGANFPAGETLTVLMGPYGNAGVNGVQVGTLDSGSSGCFNATFVIPTSLSGSFRIAIRVEASDGIYYGYNWFYNTSTR